MTLASRITLVRVAMIPAFMVTMYLSGGAPGMWMYVSLAIFIIASLTDSLDGYDEESGQFYGRTFADSPDIDGRVWIASDEPVHEGDFVMVKIDGCTDGDLCGYVVEEEA